jgi:plasmid stabilization system protein ParE
LSYALEFRPEAEEDLRSAYHWYESQRAGLGEQFLLCIEAALALVRDNPHLGCPPTCAAHPDAAVPLWNRLRRGASALVVFAVFHGHRDPRDWLRRLP